MKRRQQCLLQPDPSDLGRWSLQGGLEYIGQPWDFWIPTRSVAAVDVQSHEEGGWQPDVSPKLGLQFGSGRGEQRSIRLRLEYYNGKSPNGQFLDCRIQ